jgi:hypothetical protein
MTRKNSLARQARRAYRQGDLARICTLREDRFGRAFGMQTVRVEPKWKSYGSGRPEDYYHFRDNNSSVLAVAHLDTVVSQEGRTPRFRATEKGPLIVSGALDDRLGAYVILNLLPKLGVTCDWLLTVGEESGASTAESFDSRGKKYDWMIEFDRAGTDVVMYQYEDRASERLVEAAGAVMGSGSFSDVAYLEHLDVKGFNWGVGYRGDYHSERGYAYLDDTFRMVAKYLRFHEQNAGTHMPHEPERASRSYGSSGRHDKDEYYRCDSCGERAVDSVTWYCTFCGLCADCGATDPDVAAEWNDPDVDVCQCYAPKQRGTGDQDDHDWRAVDWDEYCKQRPAGPDDDALCDDCGKDADACTCALEDAHAEAQDRDGPGTLVPAGHSPSLAPPWSEHRPVSHGLGVPTSQTISGRRRADRASHAAGLSGDLADEIRSYAARLREENAQLTARFGQARSAVNPPAVFPDADLGWHHAARNGDLHVVSHEPSQDWAPVCLRCAARWPHPVGSVKIHPDADCPGCEHCTAGWWTRTGTKHVIPAHLAGESDLCGLCRELNTGPDAAGAALREIAMRALDEPGR